MIVNTKVAKSFSPGCGVEEGGSSEIETGIYLVSEAGGMEEADKMLASSRSAGEEQFLMIGGVLRPEQVERAKELMEILGSGGGRLVVMRKASEIKPAAIIEDSQGVIRAKDLEINIDRHEIRLDGEAIDLTFSEFETIKTLARCPGRVFTRDSLIHAVHGDNYSCTPRAVDVVVTGLRKKLGRAAGYIETIRGVGYRFVDEAT